MSSPYLDTLNKEQREAVLHTEGPLLILAGAGSGKTRVITHRIAYLIEECGVEPWNIMAITFTNKAAGEMRERAQHLIGAGADGLWVSTFHASCARILRRYADRIGYGTNYTIYDTDDTRSVMKEICKRLNLDRDRFKPREILNRISRSKDNGYDAQDYAAHVQGDSYRSVIAQAYLEYEKTLRNANAMDFDDLLLNTVRLLQRDEEVLTSYQNRFRYIMVDEYQDTNDIQFRLLELLAAGSRNLCVVGDDDQSIYRFRGANIRNILEFEQVYPDAFVVKLEQNYRSTQTILDAANAVIRNNEGRKDKRLWTEEGEGALIRLQSFSNAIEEARFIAQEVGSRKRAEHVRLSDMAVLYRTNAQSRLIEEFLVKEGIPYNLVGGTSFYTRREIRDLLAYLKTIECGTDDLSLLRIINVPRRGIGATTIGRLRDYAAMEEISLLAACEGADRIIALSKSAAEKCRSFAEQIREFRAFQMKAGLEQLLNHIIDTIGYEDYLNSIEAEEREDQVDRMENVNELLSKVADYESRAEEPSLAGFLEDVALVADIDELSEDQDRVLLMTLHSAKGLEFDHVFITGLEEGLFPSWPAVESEDDDPAAMEEERRLAYVGITRARKRLTLTWARNRLVRGEPMQMEQSRFIREIPYKLLEEKGGSARRQAASFLFDGGETIEEDEEIASLAAGRHTETRPQQAPPRATIRSVPGIRPQPVTNPVATPKRKKARATPKERPFIAGAARQQESVLGTEWMRRDLSGLRRGLPAVEEPVYVTGDRVAHVKYGNGTVMALVREEKDYKVTVDFDECGTKIMYAAFAKLRKV